MTPTIFYQRLGMAERFGYNSDVARHTRKTSVLFLCLIAALVPRAQAQTEDKTFDTAVFLLQSCKQVDRQGRHIALIRALRHMQDPQLRPLFASLVQSPYTPFKVHGMLGLAECSKDKLLDLVRIAAIEDPSQQAQVVSASMDAELLTDEQARQIYEWPGIDNSVQLVVATQLVKAGLLKDLKPLQGASAADNLGRKYLAMLLLAQLGDAAQTSKLNDLHQSDDKKRDQVRFMLLSTALEFDFDAIGPWALAICSETGANRRLALRALKAALRFKVPGAVDVWRAQLRSTGDLAQQMRLALTALQLAPWVDGEIFADLVAHENERIREIGLTGQAVVNKQGVVAQALKLIDMNYQPASGWAMSYALHHSEPADAIAIFAAFIRAGNGGPDRFRTRRLDDAVLATQSLYELDAKAATPILRPLLENPDTDPLLAQGILLGLIRCGTPQPHLVIKDAKPFGTVLANHLALLLRARYGQGLSPEALEELSLVVRGGGMRNGALRIQAAWLYLKITNQTDAALAAVLGA